EESRKADLVRSNLVNDLVVYRKSIVRAVVIVEVALVQAAELKQVITFDPTDVVAECVVVPTPNSLTRILVVDVKGNQGVRAFRVGRDSCSLRRGNLKRASQTGNLRRSTFGRPLPPVVQIAEARVVCNRRR